MSWSANSWNMFLLFPIVHTLIPNYVRHSPISYLFNIPGNFSHSYEDFSLAFHPLLDFCLAVAVLPDLPSPVYRNYICIS